MNGVVSLYEGIRRLSLNVLPNIVSQIEMNHLHVGEYKMSAASSDFTGWLICDGRSVSRIAYKELFEVIGTTFGSEDDDSFNLPDFRGRAIGIAGQGIGLTNRALGAVVGSETHVLTPSEMPNHTHTATAASAGSHNHGGATSTTGSHSHTTNATGGSTGLAVSDGTNTVVDTDASPNELNVWTTPAALTVNSAGDHSHTITSDGSHTHTITVASAGSSMAHNIMQPTLFGCNMFIYSGVVSA